jgi:predicted permease
VANLLGFHIPGWLEPTVSRLGAASLALGLMAAGAGMRLGSLGRARVLSVSVLLIKHLLLPLVALLLSYLLGLSKAQTLVLLAFSALPTAPTAYVLAARMGYDGPLVAGLVTVSTLLGLLSLPFAISLIGLLP